MYAFCSGLFFAVKTWSGYFADLVDTCIPPPCLAVFILGISSNLTFILKRRERKESRRYDEHGKDDNDTGIHVKWFQSTCTKVHHEALRTSARPKTRAGQATAITATSTANQAIKQPSPQHSSVFPPFPLCFPFLRASSLGPIPIQFSGTPSFLKSIGPPRR